jgi:prefoldin subunit 5
VVIVLMLLFEEKAQKLDQENKELKNEIDELKDALDAATESEEMIEKLTNTNLALEDVCSIQLLLQYSYCVYSILILYLQQVRELQSTIEELEEMKTLSEELEENLVAVEKQLRSELCMC